MDKIFDDIEKELVKINGINFEALEKKVNHGGIVGWHNRTWAETMQTINVIQNTLTAYLKHPRRTEIAFNGLLNVHAQLAGIYTSLINLDRGSNSANYQNFQVTVESSFQVMQNTGIYFLVNYFSDTAEAKRQSDELINEIEIKKKSIESFESSLKALTEKAVSGALSTSYGILKKELKFSERIWFGWVLFSIFFMLGSLYYIEKYIFKTTGDITVFYVLSRFAYISPWIYFLWFAMAQYRRERTLRQEYAHREAVASSLPAYKNQLVDQAARDNISVAASHVIFDIPNVAEGEMKLKKLIGHIKDINDLKK